jgi:phenylacetate-CoA ligase
MILGSAFRRHARFVAEAERWPAGRSRQYQLQAVQRMVRLAYEKTVFYRRAFDAIGFEPGDVKSLEDLRRLPTIDKTDLREHLDEMCTGAVNRRGVDFTSTGGTSGVPLHFYIGKERSAIEYAYLSSAWGRVGYRPGMPMAVIRGRVVPVDRDGLRHEYDPVLKHHYYSNFHMTEENMRRYLDHIRGIGPCFLHVYPSSAAVLARFLVGSRLRPLENIRGVIAESENVYDDQRLMIEQAFGARFFSCYGHTEKLVQAAECEHSTTYHVWPTYGYFELLDVDGNPVTTPGETGEITGTGFINTIVPFIRYRTGDYAVYVGERCRACGREHTLIREIRGHRTPEMLYASDGSMVFWTGLNMHGDAFVNVRQFQFYQDTPGRAVLRVVPTATFTDDDRRRILTNLNAKLDGRLDVEITIVQAIPLSPRGKAIYVEQKIAPWHDVSS